MKKTYNSPVLDLVLIGQTDVITASFYETKDVMNEDIGEWY